MAETVQKTWASELLERGVALGQLQTLREDLRAILEERFGPLPETLTSQIDATDDVARLRTALRRQTHVASLAEFEL